MTPQFLRHHQRWSIRRKVLFPLALGAILIAILGVGVVVRLAWRNLLLNAQARIQTISHAVGRMIETVDETDEMQHFVNAFAAEAEVSQLLVFSGDDEHRVIAAATSRWMGKTLQDLEREGLVSVSEIDSVFRSDRERLHFDRTTHRMRATIPILLDTPKAILSHGLVFVELDTRVAEVEVMKWAWRVAMALVFVITLLLITATILIQRFVIEPVAEIARVTKWRAAYMCSFEQTDSEGDELDRLAVTVRSAHDAAHLAQVEANRLAMVVRNTNNAVVITDANRRITWVNDAFLRICGYQREELIGKSPGKLLQYEGTDPRTIQLIRERLNRREPVRVEVRNRSHTGHEYWIDLEIEPIFDDADECVGFMSTEIDITERVQLQSALQNVTNLLQTATSVSGTGLWDWNPQTDETWFSDEWFTMLGYEPQSLPSCGSTWNSLLHPIDEATVVAALQEHLAGRTARYESEMRMLRKDGSWQWIQAVGSVVERDTHGHPTRVAGVHIDIHRRKLAEEHLAQRESDYASLLSNIDGVVYRCQLDRDWTMNYISESAERLTGYPSNEFVRNAMRSFASIIYHEDVELVDRAVADAIAANQGWHIEYRLVHRDGRIVWVYERGKASRSSDGRVTHLDGFIVDVTQNKAAQQQLIDTQDRMRMLVEGTDVIVWEQTLERKAFRYVSPQAERLGYPLERWMEANFWADHIHPEDRSSAVDKCRAETAAGRNHRLQYRMIAADGHVVWIDDFVTLGADHDGKPVLRGVFIDVSAQRQIMDDLKVARHEAETANIAKSEFLANMSHELRTPMTAILGYADLLLDGNESTSESLSRMDHLCTIKRNGEHLLAIINDILDLSKIEAGQMTIERIAVKPLDLCRQVIELMQARANAKGLQLRMVCCPEVPETICSDPIRLRQILVNLIGNAIKFTEVGTVTLRADLMHQRGTRQLQFAVEDTGIGMTPTQLDSLFRPFTQADTSTTRRFGGTGLGLHISKRLAEKLGGDIHVESALDKGSRFLVTIDIGQSPDETPSAVMPTPSKAADAHALPIATPVKPSSSSSSAAGALDGCRILFVEDGPDNQRLISFVLRKAGASVVVVDDGAKAIQELTVDGTLDGTLKTPPPYDLMLLDMQMPVLDGYSTAARLREMGSRLAIIALTAHAMQGDREKCLDAGCDDYATKPIDRATLMQIILQHFRRPVGPVVVTSGEIPATLDTAAL